MADADAEVARLATVCSYYVYRWLHARDPEAFASISRTMLENRANAATNQARIAGEDHCSAIAEHLAWWELALDRPAPRPLPLNVPPQARKAIDIASRQLEGEWRVAEQQLAKCSEQFQTTAGLHPSMYDAAIWQRRPDDGREIPLATSNQLNANVQPFAGAFTLVADPGRHPRPMVDGTLLSAAMRAATVDNWENSAKVGFVRFARPGHSLLRLRSTVPPTATQLIISIVHMKGGRGVLRKSGIVTLRYSLTGLSWEHTESGPYDGGKGRQVTGDSNWAARSTLHVPVHIFADTREVEFVIEYLHGNTTHRILGVNFEWQPSRK